jgi:hypothetical protein
MFQVDQSYSKEDIYSILHVPLTKQKGAWNTGYHEYEGEFFIFANIGVAGRTGHDYDNQWDENDNLLWYGKTHSHIGQSQIQRMLAPSAIVHIFTRQDARDPFVYKGIGKASHPKTGIPFQVTWLLQGQADNHSFLEWTTFAAIARAYLQLGEDVYDQNLQYKIIDASPQAVSFQTEGHPDIQLTASIFTAAMKSFTRTGKFLLPGSQAEQAIRASAIVQLLPTLDYDEMLDGIILEAPDDLERMPVTKLLRLRRGQNKLRKNLLTLYQGKCCISGFHIEETLHACHILPHAAAGDNRSTNALLLRSDLHDLFDVHLMGIHPDTLKVAIKKSLFRSEYAQFEGRTLAHRTDNKKPNVEALRERWNFFQR